MDIDRILTILIEYERLDGRDLMFDANGNLSVSN